MKIEVRAGNAVHIEGYVNAVERDSHVITVPSIGQCVEQIKAGVFDTALRAASDVMMLENHDETRRLGSISEGNLKLYEDNIGLRAIADIVDADIADKARRKMLKGWSFGFICTDSEIEQRAGNVPRRIVKGMTLSEVSLIDGSMKPCYSGTSVEVRADGFIREFRAAADDNIEYSILDSVDTSTDAENAPVDSTADGETVENRSEDPDYSYYDAMLRYLELRYNPYHDPGNGRFCSGGGGGGEINSVLYIPQGHAGVYKGNKAAMQKSMSSASQQASERIKAMGGTVDENGRYSFQEHGGLMMIQGQTGAAPTTTINVQTGNVASQATNSSGGLTNANTNSTIGNMGETNKTSRDYGSELAKAIGQTRYDEICQQIDNSQNSDLQKLYSGNINKMAVTYDPQSAKSCQNNGKNSIMLNELGEETTSGRAKNSVVFHEGAHAIDNQLGGGGKDQYFSLSWNNGAFGKSLQSEVDDYVTSRHNQLKAEYDSNKGNAAWLREHVAPLGSKGFPDKAIVAIYGNKKYTKSIAYNSIKNEISRSYKDPDKAISHQAGCVSDLFGLGTNNRARNGMGHDDKYAKTGVKFALPVEGFAEFSECTATGHTDFLQKYFPKTYVQYEKMLTDGAATY